MAAHTATVSASCPDCGGITDEHYKAWWDADGLRHAISVRCRSCSHMSEADGRELTDDVRAVFEAAEGRWCLRVRDLGPNRIGALRIVQQLHGAGPPAELLRIVREQSVVAGALIEIEHAEELLRDAGVDVERLRG